MSSTVNTGSKHIASIACVFLIFHLPPSQPHLQIFSLPFSALLWVEPVELSWPGPLHFWLLIVFRARYDWQEIDEQEERSQRISIPIPFLSCHHNSAKCWVPLGKEGPTLTVASLSQFLSLLFQTAVALAFFWLVSSCLNIPFMISLNLPIPL